MKTPFETHAGLEQEMRDAFEAFVSRQLGYTPERDDDVYVQTDVQEHYCTWQEATKQSLDYKYFDEYIGELNSEINDNNLFIYELQQIIGELRRSIK